VFRRELCALDENDARVSPLFDFGAGMQPRAPLRGFAALAMENPVAATLWPRVSLR